jgi:hypothetical protein
MAIAPALAGSSDTKSTALHNSNTGDQLNERALTMSESAMPDRSSRDSYRQDRSRSYELLITNDERRGRS